MTLWKALFKLSQVSKPTEYSHSLLVTFQINILHLSKYLISSNALLNIKSLAP